ncbi:MAG: signal peptidase I [Chloroflexota bacterium]
MLRALRETLQTLLLALLLFAGLQATIQNYRVEGSSMEPTLSSDEYLLVNKLVYYRIDKARLARYLPFIDAKPGDVAYLFHPPQHGDIVVFHYPKDPSRDFVKRVIGVPGDTIEINNGRVYVNGEPLEERYVSELARTSMARETLGAEQYFVLGDNRPHSNDSKDWGTVPLEDIVGSGWITYWPLSQLGIF